MIGVFGMVGLTSDKFTSIPDPGQNGIVRLSEPELDRQIQNYILDLKSQQSIGQAANELNDFFPLVQKIILSRQNWERVPEDKRLLFLEDDPIEALDTEAVTFEIQSRIPGRFDQGPAGRGKIKEVSSHYRGERDHPDHPGEKLVVMGKFYDNWIRFYVYAKTNKEARKRLFWFEGLMASFEWFFRINGFRVVEEEVGRRERVEIDGVVVTRYPVVYMVRSEDIHFYSAQKLKEVIISPSVSTT